METKYLSNRKKIPAALRAVFLMGFWACAAAADYGLEMRQRLDSLEVETQVRKRQGKPIEDLEAASAELRDSLTGLRTAPARPAAAREERDEGGLPPYLEKIPFIEDILAFRPSGAFDWVIVGTGAVALLSGLMLFIGLFAGRKKKRAAPPKKQQASRKINLAPTSTQRAVPEANNNNSEPPPRDSVAEFQALVENLRKVAPTPPPKAPPPFAAAEPELPPRRTTPPPPKEPEPRRAPPPPEEPPAPLPLIVNAPDTPQQPMPPQPPPPPLSGKPLASEVLSARKPPPMPPPAGTGFPAFSTLVIAAAKDGIDDIEISRRYQLSVDQVRLILRMERNKHP